MNENHEIIVDLFAGGGGASEGIRMATGRDPDVAVWLGGNPYVMVDIGMRMLSPRELFLAQGFREDYVIDIEIEGKAISKANQVRMCGNSVSPPNAAALVSANLLPNQRTDMDHHGHELFQLSMFGSMD